MALSVKCERCGDELEEPGGILLGPPEDDRRVKKDHLCIICYKLIKDILN